MDSLDWAYVLIAIGILAVVAELFIPSGFVLVVIGVICALAGVAMMFMYGSLQNAMAALLGVCIGGPIVFGLFFSLWPYSPMSRMLVKTAQESETTADMPANQALESLRGKTGKAVSMLRPSGVVDFEGKRVDVLTEGMVVDAGMLVRCIEIRGNRVIVQPLDNQNKSRLENSNFS